MATEEQKAIAQAHKDNLLEDLPDIEVQMSQATEWLYDVAGGFTLKDIIYKSLMTGATLTSARYRAAQKGEGDFLARVMSGKP